MRCGTFNSGGDQSSGQRTRPRVDGQVTRVEFYQGTTLIGTATAAPYAVTWQNVPEGQYSLSAKAIDNGGGETYSSTVGILVAPAGMRIYYLHSDQLNTPRVATDEQNRIVWRNVPLAEPFGTAAPEEDPDGDGVRFTLNLRFPGQYFDKETNLHYNYFRDYDPSTGRYVEADPIGLKAGPNVYTYVLGNPISYTDPKGLEVQICCRPAQIAGGLINHCWVQTGTISAGMGADPNIPPGQQYEGYGMPVQITNHANDTPTQCTPQKK